MQPILDDHIIANIQAMSGSYTFETPHFQDDPQPGQLIIFRDISPQLSKNWVNMDVQDIPLLYLSDTPPDGFFQMIPGWTCWDGARAISVPKVLFRWEPL
jgi:hypothetical protein